MPEKQKADCKLPEECFFMNIYVIKLNSLKHNIVILMSMTRNTTPRKFCLGLRKQGKFGPKIYKNHHTDA